MHGPGGCWVGTQQPKLHGPWSHPLVLEMGMLKAGRAGLNLRPLSPTPLKSFVPASLAVFKPPLLHCRLQLRNCYFIKGS